MPQEAKADALIGTVLEGRFHVEQLLGEGGMGRVYVADEKRLQRRCALKVLLPELAGDKDCVERFLREAQAIAQIHHENVVDIYHLGDDSGDGVVFFAMELLQGEDLETRLADRERRPISWEQICQWIGQAAGAVAAVHAAGMIHRDLKPSNIFISRRRDGRDRIKLLDFGIVKTVNTAALTGTGAAIGTPYYMSPEQILALPLDARSDIYSLGALFFEALAGRMVFLGEPLQVAMQHCNIAPPRVIDVATDIDVPPELDELVQSMLAKDPGQRPQSMEEIEELLLQLLPLPPNLHNSGSARPITGRHTGQLPSLIDSSEGDARPFTPSRAASGPAAAAAALARTTLALPLPPTSTVELDLETHSTRRARSRHLPLIVGAAALIGAVVTLLLLPRDEPAPEPPVAPVVATPTPAPTPAPTPPPAPPPADPVVQPPEPVPVDTSSKPLEPGKPRRPSQAAPDPLRKIAKAATACRKQHKAIKGPKIAVDYAIGSDGRVTRAVPATQDALGKCLAAAVKQATFPAQLKLGLKIDL